MKALKPIPMEETPVQNLGGARKPALDAIYKLALDLVDGTVLPVEFDDKKRAAQFASLFHMRRSRAMSLGLGARLRANTVYIYRKDSS